MAVGLGKTLFFARLLNKGLDDADAGDVLLNDHVQTVEAFLQNGEQGIGAPDHKDDVQQDQRKRAGDDHAETGIQRQQRGGAAEKEHDAAGKTADQLDDEALHLGDVVGDARDERAGAEVVGLIEGEMHDPVKAELADLIGAALTGNVGEDAGQNPADTAGQNEQQHPDPRRDDQVHIGNAAAGKPEDALIDDQRHHAGLIQIDHDLGNQKENGQQRRKPVFFDEAQQE